MVHLQIEHLTKKIRGQTILNNISLTMDSGYIYGLQGVNGSGKTMLMRTIIGLVRPTSGRVMIDGREIGSDISFPESIGFLLEAPTFLDRYSGYINLKILADMKGLINDKQIYQAIETVGLDPSDNKKYKKYSLGMKQRLGIAAAIMEMPDIVILDEPTNALDTSGVMKVKEILLEQKERGALVLISSHDLNILQELADVIIQIENGCLKNISP